MTSQFFTLSRPLPLLTLIPPIAILLILFAAGCTKEGPTGPPGPTGEINLMDPAIQPSVVSTMPQDFSAGPFDLFTPGIDQKPNFIVEFNKLINIEALQPSTVTVQGFDRPQRVQLFDYYYPIRVQSRNLINGPYDDILAFSIYDSASYGRSYYRIGTSYSVTVDSSLMDINGNHLQRPFTFSFTPEPYFRATAFDPADHSVNNDRMSYPTITFNSPIDASLLPSLHINPPVDGSWQLLPGDSLRVTFQHSVPFSFDAEYTVSVERYALDAYGHRLLAPASALFGVIFMGIDYTTPRDGATETDLTRSIYTGFTGFVDTGSIRQAFSISPSTTGLLHPSSLSASFVPANGLIPSARYTITYSTALMSIDSVHPAKPFNFSFTTGPFVVSGTYPSSGEIGVDRSAQIWVYFNGPLDTASARPAFHISHDVQGSVRAFDRSIQFTPMTQFAALTRYTVTIDSTVSLRSGYRLGAPYTFSFTTGQ